jgi:hypothetical protein
MAPKKKAGSKVKAKASARAAVKQSVVVRVNDAAPRRKVAARNPHPQNYAWSALPGLTANAVALEQIKNDLSRLQAFGPRSEAPRAAAPTDPFAALGALAAVTRKPAKPGSSSVPPMAGPSPVPVARSELPAPAPAPTAPVVFTSAPPTTPIQDAKSKRAEKARAPRAVKAAARAIVDKSAGPSSAPAASAPMASAPLPPITNADQAFFDEELPTVPEASFSGTTASGSPEQELVLARSGLRARALGRVGREFEPRQVASQRIATQMQLTIAPPQLTLVPPPVSMQIDDQVAARGMQVAVRARRAPAARAVAVQQAPMAGPSPAQAAYAAYMQAGLDWLRENPNRVLTAQREGEVRQAVAARRAAALPDTSMAGLRLGADDEPFRGPRQRAATTPAQAAGALRAAADAADAVLAAQAGEAPRLRDR